MMMAHILFLCLCLATVQGMSILDRREAVRIVFARTQIIIASMIAPPVDDSRLDFVVPAPKSSKEETNNNRSTSTSNTGMQMPELEPDAIIIGSGLAGMTVAIRVLDRGGTVVIIEKEHTLGGNSMKASSGINAASDESFYNDTLKSAGNSAQPEMISILVSNSNEALTWLQERFDISLDLVSQLGGHVVPRTHRPSQGGSVGFSIMQALEKAVREYEDKATILVDTQVTSLVTVQDQVVGVVMKDNSDSSVERRLHGTNVVLATGGFAANRNPILQGYRPDLVKIPATAGNFSTGDGIVMAKRLGASLVDMDKVQLHPTGFVDPKDPTESNKILAAEVLRGVGGVLLNSQGARFCNELGTRDYIIKQMQSQKEPAEFFLVMSGSAAEMAKTHMGFYLHKGLMKKLQGVRALADWMGVPAESLSETFTNYFESAATGKDNFGKVSFGRMPNKDLHQVVFYAGRVTPVLHYCMGGIAISTDCAVLNETGESIPGLYAVGEVTGGIHGDNRLGGNSLLECVVFGSAIGAKIPIRNV